MKNFLVLAFTFLIVNSASAIYLAPEVYETDMYDIKNFLAIASEAPIFVYMSCDLDQTRKIEFIIERNPEISDRADIIMQKKLWNGKPIGEKAYIVLNAKLKELRHSFVILADMDNKNEGHAFIKIEELETGLYTSYRGIVDINLAASPAINTPAPIYNTRCELLR